MWNLLVDLTYLEINGENLKYSDGGCRKLFFSKNKIKNKMIVKRLVKHES
jgi:hypothetical protein